MNNTNNTGYDEELDKFKYCVNCTNQQILNHELSQDIGCIILYTPPCKNCITRLRDLEIKFSA